MNISIIGLGYWGKHYVRIVNSSEHKLTAICDLNEETFEKYKHIKTNFYTNYITMFKKEQLDGVIIVTIAKFHLKIIKDALKYDLKVFVEKPYTLSLKDCNELESILDKRDKLMVGHTYLFNSKIQFIREYLKEEMKDVKSISFTWTCFGPIRKDTNPIFDLSVHPISILLYLFPNKKITNINTVRTKTGNSYFINFILGDIIVQFNISWACPGKTRKIIISDEKNKLIFDDVSNKEPVRVLKLKNPNINVKNNSPQTLIHSDGNIYIPQIDNSEPLTDQFNEWVKYCNDGVECISNHKFSKKVIELCEILQ